jgi:hypothetical protein
MSIALKRSLPSQFDLLRVSGGADYEPQQHPHRDLSQYKKGPRPKAATIFE